MPNADISPKPARALRPDDLRIGGFEPFSTVDFPDRIAAVVFCQGCPLRCGYCHNKHLIPSRAERLIDWRSIEECLQSRAGLLDAVVFSGGEPLAQRALVPAMRRMKELGFAVGLHTSGAYPERLAPALSYADWVGFDVKAPFADYPAITGAAGSGEKAKRSLEALVAAGASFEARTTIEPTHFTPRSFLRFATELRSLGVRTFALQEARPPAGTPPPLGAHPIFDNAELTGEIRDLFPSFAVRRAFG